MKIINWLLLLGLLGSLSVNAGQERGAGLYVEAEFAGVAREVLRAIKTDLAQHGTVFEGFTVQSFEEALSTNEVRAREEICEEETDLITGVRHRRCLDARYLIDLKRIEFDLNRWEKKTCLQQLTIAAHEFGRASGNEDGNYKFSSRLSQVPAVLSRCNAIDYERESRRRNHCSIKAQRLELSLRQHDGVDISDEHKRADYIVRIRSIFEEWAGEYGRGCKSLGEEIFWNVCYAKAGDACF